MPTNKPNTKLNLEKPMHYSAEVLSSLPENILLKYTIIDYELHFPAEKGEAAIAQLVGVSEAAIDNYKAGRGCLSRKAWKLIYNATKFELIKEWDDSNRIGG